MLLIKLNESTAARKRIPLYLVDATDGYTPETGVTSPTIEVSKAGAAQASGTGTFTEIGDGAYYYEFASGEIDTLGFVNVRVVKSGTTREFQALAWVVAYDPYDATTLGLSTIDDNLDAAVSSRAEPGDAMTLDAGAIDSTKFAPNAIDAAALDATAGTEIATAVWASATRTLTSFGSLVANIWDYLVSSISTSGSIGKQLKDNVDTTVSSRSTVTVAQVNAECDTAIADAGIPAAVWSQDITAFTVTDTTGMILNYIRQLHTNKIRVKVGATTYLELMKDDGTTVLKTFQVRDKDGAVIDFATVAALTPVAQDALA